MFLDSDLVPRREARGHIWSFHSLRFMRNVVPSVACLILLGTAGCVTRGYLRLGKPTVSDSTKTLSVLENSGEALGKKIREGGQLGTVQEFSGTRDLISSRGSFGRQSGIDVDETSGPFALPNSSASLPADLPTAAEIPTFQRTLRDQINDYVNQENFATDVELLYSEELLDIWGPNARAYRVQFDMGIFPTKQSYWKYPFLWVRSAFQRRYNFTDGWFARVSFQMSPVLEDSLLYVGQISPRYDVYTATESLSNERQVQFLAGYSTPETAVQAEYIRRLEEQFAQQRRYPLQMGFIENSQAFSWVFGPRRQIKKRSWLASLNPFLSTYKVFSRLEPGMRRGHVILVVPDIVELQNRLRQLREPTDADLSDPERTQIRRESTPEGQERLRESILADRREERRRMISEEDRGRLESSLKTLQYELPDAMSLSRALEQLPLPSESPSGDSVVRIDLLVNAAYIELDRPDRAISMDVTGEGLPRKLSRISVDLPVGPPPLARSARIHPLTPNEIVTLSDGKSLLFQLRLGSGSPDLLKEPPTGVDVLDPCRRTDLKVVAFSVVDSDRVNVVVELPKKPKTATADTFDTCPVPVLRTRFSILKGVGSGPFAIQWSAKEESKEITMSPAFGTTGRQLTLSFPDSPTASEVEEIRFGDQVFTRRTGGTGPGFILREKEGGSSEGKGKIYFQVPQPPPGSQHVDVVLILRDKNGKEQDPHVVGAFTYLTHRED